MSDTNRALGDTINLAQSLLHNDKNKGKKEITPTLISERVKYAASILNESSDEPIDHEAAVTELIRRFSRWIGKSSSLQNDVGHIAWLSASRKKDWRYWQRYQTFLERKLSVEIVDALNESTDMILERMEDPKRDGVWDRRGLVVGHVQSGKTGNYSGLVCKAADAGYKVIIVLAGLHNNLRSQTQIRLEESFLGYETSPNRDPGKPIGVGEIDSDPKIHPHCATTRADNGDFNAAVARNFAISPEERPWLFVVKKGKPVLTQLLRWIRGHVADATDADTGRRIVTNLPLLIIDDEADNASVDTGEQLFNEDGTPDEDHQPKAINSLIRQILHAFSKSAYVGYTATPFANIFIHRKGATLDEGPDLFPRSFIINLAAPSNYVGPLRVFGRNTIDGRVDVLPLTRDILDHFNPEDASGWMPPKHKKEHVPVYLGQETIPPSLREAICSFVLSCAVRVCRGQGTEHSSMLIHVTRLVKVQNEVFHQVEEALKRMRQRILRGTDNEALLAQLKDLWESDFIPTSATVAELAPEPDGPPKMPSWSEILAVLPDVLSDIVVRPINGTAKDALDYSENQDKGLKVIAIGGDKLSRGLTLEGLCTSYFVRTTKMYDTLMQMGRWFGYRPGYMDLCRLYTSSDLVEWFGHITDASEELREEFDTMVQRGATPDAYGMKVRSHPVLTVTSRLKMRNAETLSLSYSGNISQSVALFGASKQLGINLAATDKLIASMGSTFETGPSRRRDEAPDEWKRSFLWRDVSSEVVRDFLGSYLTHPDATSANSAVLAEFIKKMNDQNELKLWTVALVAEGRPGETHTFASGLKVLSLPSRSGTKVGSKFSIGVLTDPSDEAMDLDYEPWKKALEMTLSVWKPDPARGRITPPKRPSGKKIRELRGSDAGDLNRGVLLLYPLSPLATNGIRIAEDWDKPVIAFAIAFPSSESGVKVAYKVDHLYWEQEYGSSE
jgi:hypothetical protein